VEENMNAGQVFHKILVAIDFSEASLAALSHAVLVGKAYDAPITVVHVIPPVDSTVGFAPGPEAYLTGWRPPEAASELEQRLEASAAEQLHDAVAHHHAEGVDLDYRVLWGAAFRETIHLVQEEGFDLVVVGTRGRSALARVLVGSTSNKLVRKCPCPVWVVQPNGKASLDAILAPIDFLEVSHESLHLAGALAARFHCSLHVLHVCAAEYGYLLDLVADDELDLYPPWHRHEVISQLHEFVKDSGVSIEPVLHVERGDVAQHILSAADRIDAGLIVMGTLGRAGVAGLLIGNTAEKVLHHSHRPLLATKPLGYVSPVLPRFSSVEA
jgi:universal stress protein E